MRERIKMPYEGRSVPGPDLEYGRTLAAELPVEGEPSDNGQPRDTVREQVSHGIYRVSSFGVHIPSSAL